MDSTTDWVIIGRFGRPHGIKGFITILSFTEPRENLLYYTDWHANINKQWQPVKFQHLECNQKLILAQVVGYQEREQVACLTNVDIAVKRSQLPKLPIGEYYWDQLIGMRVVTQQNEQLGTVTDIMATGSNDVLIVTGNRRHLIPYLLGQSIIKINDDLSEIVVDWDADF